MRLRVDIVRKEGLADPEGVTTLRALRDLGYAGVEDVHFGRTIYLTLSEQDPSAAVAAVGDMCRRLLANPIIEDYAVTVVG